MGTGGNGVQGLWGTWAMATWAMGTQGAVGTGVWGTWVMRPTGAKEYREYRYGVHRQFSDTFRPFLGALEAP